MRKVWVRNYDDEAVSQIWTPNLPEGSRPNGGDRRVGLTVIYYLKKLLALEVKHYFNLMVVKLCQH